MLKFKFEAMKCLTREADEQLISRNREADEQLISRTREADEQLISRTPICREQNVVVSKGLTIFLGTRGYWVPRS